VQFSYKYLITSFSSCFFFLVLFALVALFPLFVGQARQSTFGFWDTWVCFAIFQKQGLRADLWSFHTCLKLFWIWFFVAQHFQEAVDTTNRTPLQLSCSIFFYYFFFIVFVFSICSLVAPVVNAAYFVLFDSLQTLARIVLILDLCASDFHQISCYMLDDIAFFCSNFYLLSSSSTIRRFFS